MNKTKSRYQSRDQIVSILNQVIKASPSIMSCAIETATIKIREAALVTDDVIDVGRNECRLKRADRATLIKNSVAMYKNMHALDDYGQMEEVPITGDALFADHLNDVSALSYILKLVGGHLQQYDCLYLFIKFPVLNMDKISQGTAWNNQFINLFLWIDDLFLILRWSA